MDADLQALKRTPPHSVEAERTVLGGILVQNDILPSILTAVRPEEFYVRAHVLILEAMIALADQAAPIDCVSLAERLRRSGALEDAGGAAYLSSLMDGVPKNSSFDYYARTIHDKALLRRLIVSSHKVITASFEAKEDPQEILDEAQAAIIDVAEHRNRQGFLPVSSLTGPALSSIEHPKQSAHGLTGLPSGFHALDRLTCGFHEQELTILAARPSMGKTALALNIAQHLGISCHVAVGFFSMEMSKESVILRMLSSEALLEMKRLRTGFLTDREFDRLRLAAEDLGRAPIYVDETVPLTVREMKAKARGLRMEKHLDILFLDYIQMMWAGMKFESRNQEMSFISRSLKELAKELNIPVIGISQLSRAPERGRREPKPQLSDLRESGAIEQDADLVLLIYRADYYDRDNEDIQGIAEVNIAKQRNGPTGDFSLAFLRQFASFTDLEI